MTDKTKQSKEALPQSSLDTWNFSTASAEQLCALSDEQILENLRDLSDLPSSLIVTGMTPLIFTTENIKVSDADLNELDDQHLKLPPLEKQFLISPPASPPAGWEQNREKEPTVVAQKFELFSRLAALAVGKDSNEPSRLELFEGGANFPKIVVHTCGDVNEGETDDNADTCDDWSRPFRIPRTPCPEFTDNS